MESVRRTLTGLLTAAIVVAGAAPGLAGPPAAAVGAPAAVASAAVALGDVDPGTGCATPELSPSGSPRDSYAPPGRCELVILRAESLCLDNAPVLDYAVQPFGTPNTTVSITWIHEDGTEFVQTGLPLSGQVYWPGTVFKNGEVVDWPGWTLTPDGVWVEHDEFDFTRPSARIEFEVNPEVSTTVAYPAATAACAPSNTPGAPGGPGSPPVTRTSNALVVPAVPVAPVDPAAPVVPVRSTTKLAVTGTDSWPVLVGSALLLGVGMGLVVAAVRRQRRTR